MLGDRPADKPSGDESGSKTAATGEAGYIFSTKGSVCKLFGRHTLDSILRLGLPLRVSDLRCQYFRSVTKAASKVNRSMRYKA